MDEVSFWPLEGAADSDVEVQTSIRRGMVAFARTRLVKISTPYLKGGLLYADFERSFGVDDPDLLVWRASSLLMNPSLKAERLDRERRLDPQRFAREYEAEWTDDVAAFLPPAWVDAAVVRGRHELPPHPGVVYMATTDPHGGGPDAWPLCVSHVEGDGADARLVIDVLRSRRRVGTEAPDLEGVVREFSDVLHGYGCHAVYGDKYSGQWVRQAFDRAGIRYEDAPCDRSAAYLDLQPWIAQGRVALLDHATLVRELKCLERRGRPGGKDHVDAPRGQHEDHANVVALAVSVATQRPSVGRIESWIHAANTGAPAVGAATAASFSGSGSGSGLDGAYGNGLSIADLERKVFGS